MDGGMEGGGTCDGDCWLCNGLVPVFGGGKTQGLFDDNTAQAMSNPDKRSRWVVITAEFQLVDQSAGVASDPASGVILEHVAVVTEGENSCPRVLCREKILWPDYARLL